MVSNFNFCFVGDTVQEIKRPDTGWGKIFGKHIYDEELVSEIQKRHLILNSNNSNNNNDNLKLWKIYELTHQ